MENLLRIIVVCILFGIAWNTGYLTKDYKFIVCDGNIYRCNERTGKLNLVTCSSGVIYGNHER